MKKETLEERTTHNFKSIESQLDSLDTSILLIWILLVILVVVLIFGFVYMINKIDSLPHKVCHNETILDNSTTVCTTECIKVDSFYVNCETNIQKCIPSEKIIEVCEIK